MKLNDGVVNNKEKRKIHFYKIQIYRQNYPTDHPTMHLHYPHVHATNFIHNFVCKCQLKRMDKV